MVHFTDNPKGKYYFLSPFHEFKFVYNGIQFNSIYQFYTFEKFKSSSIQFSKRALQTYDRRSLMVIGESVKHPIRENWNNEKYNIMKTAYKIKFAHGTNFYKQLVALNSTEFIYNEGHVFSFWGSPGQNNLGKLILSLIPKAPKPVAPKPAKTLEPTAAKAPKPVAPKPAKTEKLKPTAAKAPKPVAPKPTSTEKLKPAAVKAPKPVAPKPAKAPEPTSTEKLKSTATKAPKPAAKAPEPAAKAPKPATTPPEPNSTEKLKPAVAKASNNNPTSLENKNNSDTNINVEQINVKEIIDHYETLSGKVNKKELVISLGHPNDRVENAIYIPLSELKDQYDDEIPASKIKLVIDKLKILNIHYDIKIMDNKKLYGPIIQYAIDKNNKKDISKYTSTVKQFVDKLES
jgi:predicted NAD-dependent protein-ADP-ribosyltransferase YbiA (DUF1768 family)